MNPLELINRLINYLVKKILHVPPTAPKAPSEGLLYAGFFGILVFVAVFPIAFLISLPMVSSLLGEDDTDESKVKSGWEKRAKAFLAAFLMALIMSSLVTYFHPLVHTWLH